MNLRPSGYEPDELPDCSTPHSPGGIIQSASRFSNTQGIFSRRASAILPKYLITKTNQGVRKQSQGQHEGAVEAQGDP